MRRHFAVAVASVGLCLTALPARATGIPTIDVAAQMQLKLQLDQLRQQYQALQRQLDAVTAAMAAAAVGLPRQ